MIRRLVQPDDGDAAAITCARRVTDRRPTSHRHRSGLRRRLLRLGMQRWLVVSIAVLTLWPAASCSVPGSDVHADAPAAGAPTVQVDDLPDPVAEAYRQLTAAQTSVEARRAAAEALLTSEHPAAGRVLAAVLSTRFDAGVWQPVLELLASRAAPPPAELAEPMLTLAGAVDANLRGPLAACLGRVREPRVFDRLARLARDEEAALGARVVATLALGHHRTPPAAETLVRLTDPEQPEALQQAAGDALVILSGLERPDDPEAWRTWWDSVRRLPPEAWRDHLLDNFVRRDARRERQRRDLEHRLVETHRAMYRAAPLEERPAILAKLLTDGLEAVRLLGVDLAVQRLVNDLPFEEPLREALRARLDDPSPAVRQRATLLLRDLADEPAADRVAQRLAEAQEQVTAVLRADLLMLARLPRRTAVPAALNLLGHSALRGEAAGALAAAAEANLLTPRQAAMAARQARQSLNDDTPPPPQVVTLLAHVGDEEDWQHIAGWLDSEDGAVRQAAAKAWAASQRPLAPLVDRVEDPLIEPILILAAAERGRSAQTLGTLAAHRPASDNLLEAWQRTLVAMSARVPLDAVLEATVSLASYDNTVALREQMLTVALDRDGGAIASDAGRILAKALLERGRLRLALGDSADAAADLERVAALTSRLDPADRLRLAQARIEAMLLLNEIDRAFTVAREVVLRRNERGETVDPATELFLAAAQRAMAAGHHDRATRILQELRALLGDPIEPTLNQRIALLEAEIAGATTPAAPADASPAAAPPTLNGRTAPTTQPAEPTDPVEPAADGGDGSGDVVTVSTDVRAE